MSKLNHRQILLYSLKPENQQNILNSSADEIYQDAKYYLHIMLLSHFVFLSKECI